MYIDGIRPRGKGYIYTYRRRRLYVIIILYTLRLVLFRFCRNTMKYYRVPEMYYTCDLSRLNETKLIFY